MANDFWPIEGQPLSSVGNPRPAPIGSTSYDQGAYDALIQTLKQYGLESLAPAVLNFLQDGYSQDQVSIMIQDTPEYKQRFAGNDKRRAAGIPALTPKDYLSVESAYRQILSTSGMPQGFYDQPSDYADWIGKDVAPQEISTRVGLAVDAADKMDATQAGIFADWYGVGKNDLAAFFLDQERALPHIQRTAKAAQLGAAYVRNGLDWRIGPEGADRLAGMAGTRDVTQLAAQVAETTKGGERLSNIYGGPDYGLADAEAEAFANDQQAKKRRLDLAGREEAAFAGSSAVGQSTLSKPAQY